MFGLFHKNTYTVSRWGPSEEMGHMDGRERGENLQAASSMLPPTNPEVVCQRPREAVNGPLQPVYEDDGIEDSLSVRESLAQPPAPNLRKIPVKFDSGFEFHRRCRVGFGFGTVKSGQNGWSKDCVFYPSRQFLKWL